jgi:hypothetical protein
VNLLDHFVLQHVQVSELRARLISPAENSGSNETKVELNLTPRLMQTDGGEQPPSYQVSARLSCKGGRADEPGPEFSVRAGIEAIYQQTSGAPVDLAEFSANHASLTRQLYPLLQQELRVMMLRMGLEQVHLPFDLAPPVESAEGSPVQVSGAVH